MPPAHESALATGLLAFTLFWCVLSLALVLARSTQRRTHQAFAALAMCLAVSALAALVALRASDSAWATGAGRVAAATAALAPLCVYWFSAVYPHQRFEGYRAIAVLYGVAGLGLAGASLAGLVVGAIQPAATVPAVALGPLASLVPVLLLTALGSSGWTLWQKLHDTTGQRRRQIEHLLLTLGVLAIAGVATPWLMPAIAPAWTAIYGLALAALGLSLACYALLHYYLRNIREIAATTLLYVALSATVVAVYVALVASVDWLLSDGGSVRDLLTIAVTALVIAAVLVPLKERVHRAVDRLVLKRQFDPAALVSLAGRRLARCLHLDAAGAELFDVLRAHMGVHQLRIFLRDPQRNGAVLLAYSSEGDASDVPRWDLNNLMDTLADEEQPVLVEAELAQLPAGPRAVFLNGLASLDALLCIPLATANGVLGFVACGEKIARESYTRLDLRAAEALAGPLAAAIENTRLYEDLESLNTEMQQLLRHMRGGVLSVDGHGRILSLNRTAGRLLGDLRAGDGLARLPEGLAQVVRHALDEQRSQGDHEVSLTGPDGEELVVATSVTVVKRKEDAVRAVVMLYDLTHLRRLESTVERADRLSSLGTMAAGMAHEIKNPLVSIKTFSQLMHERFDDPDFRATYSEVVPAEVERIDRLVSRLLDLARPRPVEYRVLELPQIIARVVALTHNQMAKADIAVRTDLDEGVGPVYADEQRLHQMFLNLMLNALDAMRDSARRELMVRCEALQANLPQAAGLPRREWCAQVTVSDTGVGIAADKLATIFNPFFTTKSHGSGLGLAVVHSVVVEHGGTIDVQSIEGVGTSFTVLLPLAKVPAAQEAGA